MSAGRLLVVEDDQALAGGLVRGLRSADFEVELLSHGQDLVPRVLSGKHDIVILDLMLPGASGFELLERLQHRSSVPIIVLTARAALEDRLRSFQLGAVDYVCKPFWIEELIARIRARLGLGVAAPKDRLLEFGNLRLNLAARQVCVEQEEIKLTKTEYDILVYLAERKGRAISRGQIAQHVLPTQENSDVRTVDAHVTRLRKKLGPAAPQIATAWGIGYRFEPAGAS
jgi:DNA-binding response OmpR family regulator